MSRQAPWKSTNDEQELIFRFRKMYTIPFKNLNEALREKYTTRTRQIDSSGEDLDLECKAPAKGKLPPSPTRRVEPTCLLAITS